MPHLRTLLILIFSLSCCKLALAQTEPAPSETKAESQAPQAPQAPAQAPQAPAQAPQAPAQAPQAPAQAPQAPAQAQAEDDKIWLDIPTLPDYAYEASPEVLALSQDHKALEKALKSAPERLCDEKLVEALFLSAGTCQIINGDIDQDCPFSQFTRFRRYCPNLLLYLLLINHPNPAIRTATVEKTYALTQRNSYSPIHMGNAPDALKAYFLAYLEREKDPAVLENALPQLGSGIFEDTVSWDPRYEQITQLLLRLARHENRSVRVNALSQLEHPGLKGHPDVIELLRELFLNEKDDLILSHACLISRMAGGIAFKTEVLNILNNLKSKAPRIFRGSDCFSALQWMWWSPPLLENNDREAYEYSLALLKAKNKPHWMKSRYGYIVFFQKRPQSPELYEAWKAQNPWFDVEDFLDAVANFVLDVSVSGKLREFYIDLLMIHGYTLPQMRDLLRKIKAIPKGKRRRYDEYDSIKEALEKAIASMEREAAKAAQPSP